MDITLLPGCTTRSSHEINMLPSVKPRGQICLIFWIKFNFVSRAPADWGGVPFYLWIIWKFISTKMEDSRHCIGLGTWQQAHSFVQGPPSFQESPSLSPYTIAVVPMAVLFQFSEPLQWKAMSGPQTSIYPSWNPRTCGRSRLLTLGS